MVVGRGPRILGWRIGTPLAGGRCAAWRSSLSLRMERTAVGQGADLDRPRGGGFEAIGTEWPHQPDATRDIPIIALSAHAMAGDREKALATHRLALGRFC